MRIPVRTAAVPVAKGAVSDAPSSGSDSKTPVTGTPSMAVDMAIAGRKQLAALTATKQNTVATGPTNMAEAKNVIVSSAQKSPSMDHASAAKRTVAKNLCHGAKANGWPAVRGRISEPGAGAFCARPSCKGAGGCVTQAPLGCVHGHRNVSVMVAMRRR